MAFCTASDWKWPGTFRVHRRKAKAQRSLTTPLRPTLSGPSLEATSNAASPRPNPMSVPGPCYTVLAPAAHAAFGARRGAVKAIAPKHLHLPFRSHPQKSRGVLPRCLPLLRNYPARRDLPVRTKTSRCAGSLVTGGLGPEPAAVPTAPVAVSPEPVPQSPDYIQTTGTKKQLPATWVR